MGQVGSWFPNQVWNHGPLWWKMWTLSGTAGPPGRSLADFFLNMRRGASLVAQW